MITPAGPVWCSSLAFNFPPQTLPGDHVRPLQQLLPPEVVGAVQQSVAQSADALDKLTTLADSIGLPRLAPFDMLRSGLTDAAKAPPPQATVVRAGAQSGCAALRCRVSLVVVCFSAQVCVVSKRCDVCRQRRTSSSSCQTSADGCRRGLPADSNGSPSLLTLASHLCCVLLQFPWRLYCVAHWV